ncbi:DUF2516 family protein [Nocardioidaceae bacterium]|nr:DUF2516 family protein [Nocardioidaceae bacterium]
MELITGITLLAAYALLAVKLWALIDAVTRPSEAYEAAGKLTKPAWLLILGLALVAHLIDMQPVGLLNVVGTVAAFVYLLDVRPALARLRR